MFRDMQEAGRGYGLRDRAWTHFLVGGSHGTRDQGDQRCSRMGCNTRGKRLIRKTGGVPTGRMWRWVRRGRFGELVLEAKPADLASGRKVLWGSHSGMSGQIWLFVPSPCSGHKKEQMTRLEAEMEARDHHDGWSIVKNAPSLWSSRGSRVGHEGADRPQDPYPND